MLKVLFSQTAQLRRYDFLKGCFVLFLIQCFIFIVGILFMKHWPEFRQMSVMLIYITTAALIYPYYCLYGKRLEDLGLNRLWFIPITICFLLTYAPMQLLGTHMLSSSLRILMNYGFLEHYPATMITIFGLIPMTVTAYTGSIVIGLVLGLRKKSDFSGNNFSTA